MRIPLCSPLLLLLVVSSSCGGATTDAESTSNGGATARETAGACPGTAPANAGEGRRCRTRDDCASPELSCQSVPPSGCGDPFPVYGCSTDADCTAEQRCAQVGAPSCSGLGRSRACVAPCAETGCDADYQCAGDGHCRPELCAEGFECPVGKVCTPEEATDPHGCRPARCDSGAFVCAEGFACAPEEAWADANGCTPTSCHDGYQCPVNQRCGDANAYNHECERLACTRDDECDCGYCISGQCHESLFYCAKPPIG